jgi:hypothetical protein
MSPALKAAVSVGSLAGARIFPQGQKPDLDIPIGWKKAALEDASRTLINAADRMSQDSGGTEKFVEGVLKIRAAGWGIVQMPATGGDTQQGVLKLFYGFQKGMLVESGLVLRIAGSDYHDPGIGYLKESASGDLVFTREPRFADKTDRMLRIRIETKDGITSSFTGPKDFTGSGLSDIEIELTKARDAVFDEELYHEVSQTW